MKNIQLIRVVVLLFSLAIFNSCDVGVEPLDPALVNPDDNNNSECPYPTNFVASNFINNSVNLTWTPGDSETSWQIEYGLSGFEKGSGTKVISTDTAETIANLVSTNSYDFYITSICGSEVFGDAYGPITVSPVNANCNNPSNLTVVRNPTNAALATATWTAGGNENAWEIQYGTAGFIIGQGSIIQASSLSKVVDGLTNASYSFYVRAKCSATEYSNWVGPVNLAAATSGGSCVNPSGLTVVRNTVFQTQASVNWTAGGTETSWDIQYGSVGFVLGQGTIVNTTTKPKNITGLTSASYDFYVRAKCSATENSSWVGPINITAVQAIDNSPAMMTANIDGTQYDFMQPYLYSVTHNDVNVLNTGAPANEPRHLWIQGNTSDNLSTLKEINLYIPSTMFAAGTHPLFEKQGFEDIDFCQAHLIIAPGSANSTYCNITSGTITITEFNLATKRVKGTFSFVYEKSINGDPVGTFEVTNGTFNYGLDHSYFN